MSLAQKMESVALKQARRGLRVLHTPKGVFLGNLARVEDFEIPSLNGVLRARYYEPKTSLVLPALVFFHGGGFVCCDLDTHHSVCLTLAETTGARVISIDYRLAPETPFPGQLADARTACAWVLENASSLGVSETMFAVAGDSAGAYLASRMAMEWNLRSPGSVALQVLLYPLVHVDDKLWAQEELANFRFLGRVASLYIARALGEERMPSLLDTNLAHAPPTIIAGGSIMDPVSPDVRAYISALRAANIRVEAREYPLLMHGGFNLPTYLNAADKALREIGALTRFELERCSAGSGVA